MSQIKVKILADSISNTNARITTFELVYHRFFHSELMTHRVFSRGAASSRAIPSSKLLEIVETDPMLPISIGKNRPGMQASEELEESIAEEFIKQWKELGKQVAVGVKILQDLGAHKQIVNRPLEAWLPIKTVLTSTEFDNFFELRNSVYAQPEFGYLAKTMKECLDNSTPQLLRENEWHLPYITDSDKEYVLSTVTENNEKLYWSTLCSLSAARCARVSHAIGGLSKKEIWDEIEKGRELFKNKHMSPFEHQATPWNVLSKAKEYSDIYTESDLLKQLCYWLSTPNSICPEWIDVRNFRGWRQLRSFIEHNTMQL